jgi:hypothetical protein
LFLLLLRTDHNERRSDLTGTTVDIESLMCTAVKHFLFVRTMPKKQVFRAVEEREFHGGLMNIVVAATETPATRSNCNGSAPVLFLMLLGREVRYKTGDTQRRHIKLLDGL